MKISIKAFLVVFTIVLCLTKPVYAEPGSDGVVQEITPWVYSSELSNHTGSVNAVVFSPDGSVIASGSSDRTIRLWNAQTGENFQTLIGHTTAITALDFSPNGSMLVSACSKASIKIWSLESGESMHTLSGHTNQITFLAFSQDSKWIISGSDDATIRFWSVWYGTQEHVLKNPSGSIRGMAISPDGSIIATGSYSRGISIWSFSKRQVIHTITDIPSPASLTFSQDGKMLVAGFHTKKFMFWSVGDYNEIRTLDIAFFHRRFSSTLSPDGSLIAYTKYRTVSLVSADSGEYLYNFKVDGKDVYSLAFSPDSKTLVAGHSGNTVSIWNAWTECKQRIIRDSNSVRHLAISPDSRLIASTDGANAIKIRSLNDLRTVRTIDLDDGFRIIGLAFSPDGNSIAAGSNKSIAIWSLKTGKLLYNFEDDRYPRNAVGIAFNADGTKIATAAGRSMRIRTISTGEEELLTDLHNSPVTSFAYSPDGSMLATTSSDRTIAIWCTQENHLRKRLSGHTGPVNAVAFSPDGRFIVSGGNDGHMVSVGDVYGRLRIWSVSDGKMLRDIRELERFIGIVAFTPYGSMVISTGGRDYTIKMWSVNDGRLIRSLTDHTGLIRAVAFSPDGRFMASASKDRTTRIWEFTW